MLTWLKRKEKLAPEPEPAVAAQKTTKEQNKGFEKGSVEEEGQFGELCRLSQRLGDWHASRLFRRDTANRQRLDTLVNETDHMLLLGWWKERKGLGRLRRTPHPSPGSATQTDRPLPRLLSAVEL